MVSYLHVSTATLVLFTISLILGKQKVLADFILICWLLVFLSNLGTFFVMERYPVPFYGWRKFLLEFSDASVFLHGPLFLLYTRALIQPDFHFRWHQLLHFLPFALVIVLMESGKLYTGQTFNPLLASVSEIKLISVFVYLIIVIIGLLKHRKNVKHIFSNSEEKYLGWLSILSLGILILWIIGFISTLLNGIINMGYPIYDGNLMKVSTDLFIIVMSYFGFRQPAIYPSDDKPVHNGGQGDENEQLLSLKYKKSGLAPDQAKEIHARLLLLMETVKPFLNENVTLFSLAEIMKIPPNHLSQVINRYEQKNFFDFINNYRVEEVKKAIRLNQFKNFTLLGVAFECGFNSKAAFNRAFKKLTGQTPSAFKNSD